MHDPETPPDAPKVDPSREAAVPSRLRSALARTFASLRNRNYRLFFAGHMISSTGRWAQRVATGWLVWELTGSKVWLGVIGALSLLPMLFLAPVGGLVADRWQRRRILYATQSLAAVGPCALAILLLVNPEALRVWHLLVVAMIHGTVWAFDMPARQSFVIQMVGRRDLSNAIALNSSLFNVSRSVGSALGALLMATAGAALCYGFNSLSYMALVGGLLLMRFPAVGTVAQRHARLSRHPLGGLYYAWNHRAIRGTMILLTAASIFGWSAQTLLPAFAEEVFAMGSGLFGGFLSAFGLGAVAGALGMAYLGTSRRRRELILVGLVVFIASMGAFTLTHTPWLGVAALFVSGIGTQFCMSGINSYVQLLVSERFRGRVMGIYGMLFGGMMPVGRLLIGWTGETLTAQGAVRIHLAILALVTLGVALYWRRLARGDDELQSSPAPSPAS